jgi:hypothetical protein
LSRIDPAILYLREVGNKGGSQYITDFAGTAYLCLTSGRCVQSHLTDIQPAPTARGNAQNYWKYIDVSPHTVEFERLAAAVGMASRQDVVETSLIGGNALRITTRSGKLREHHYIGLNRITFADGVVTANERGDYDRSATGSSPRKSAATVSSSSARLGRSISWSISPFETGTFSKYCFFMCETKVRRIKCPYSTVLTKHFHSTKTILMISEASRDSRGSGEKYHQVQWYLSDTRLAGGAQRKLKGPDLVST